MLVEKEEEISTIITKLKNSSKLWVDTEIANWKDRKNASISLIQILPESKETTGAGVDKLLKQVIMLDVLGKPKVIQLFIETIMKNEKIEKVFHNRSFDLQFLGGKEALNVSCTLANARKIPKDLLKSENLKLGTLVTLFYPDTKVSKDEQQSDWAKRPLSEDQVKYAYLDPVYLAMIDGKLIQFAKDHQKEVDELAVTLTKMRLEKPKVERVKKEPKIVEKNVPV
jgi:ribonuclease D